MAASISALAGVVCLASLLLWAAGLRDGAVLFVSLAVAATWASVIVLAWQEVRR